MHALSRAALPVLLAAGAAGAQTQVYFSEYAFQAAQMRSMNLDGSSPQTLFLLPPAQWLPLGMTYSPSLSRLIWMDSAGGSEVNSANIDGSAPATIAPVGGFARGCSLDAAGRIYYSSSNELQRMDANGGNIITLHSSASGDPLGNPRVDATNGHVYIGVDGEIRRMNLDGSNVKTIARGISQPRAIGLDIANNHIFWLDADTHSDHVARANLDGTGFTILHDISPTVVQSPGLIELITDIANGQVYFADELTTTIHRVGVNGQNHAIIYTSPAGVAPSGLTFNTGEPAQALRDCNGNSIHDDVDIAGGAPDCDNNGVPDSCQANPCPPRVFLLDQGSNAASFSGRALGFPSQWQIFQPFDVPAGGWTISEIATDGYSANYLDGSGMAIRIYPDNGTGSIPDETQELASVTPVNLRFNVHNENWVYAPLSVTLPEGRFWVRLEGNNPVDYSGSINNGFTGLQSRSRGSSGNFTGFVSPIALRLVQGSACGSADFDGDGDTGTDADIEAFFACLGGNCCATCGSADFDGDGDTGTDADIEAFFRVLGGGAC